MFFGLLDAKPFRTIMKSHQKVSFGTKMCSYGKKTSPHLLSTTAKKCNRLLFRKHRQVLGAPFLSHISHLRTSSRTPAHTNTHTRNVERVTATESRKHLAESILKFRPTLRLEHGGVQDNTGISTPQAQIFKLKSEIANCFGFKLKSLLINIMTRGLSRYLSHGL